MEKNMGPMGRLGLMGFFILLAACPRTDGGQFQVDDPEQWKEILGVRTCTLTVHCGAGRFCDEHGLCSAECASNRDCYLYDPAAQAAWEEQKSRGVPFEEAVLPPLALRCTECGTCVPVEQAEDERCATPAVITCDQDEHCLGPLGEGYVCDTNKLCTRSCATNEDCQLMGDGHRCLDQAGRNVCVKWCLDDSSCAYHGFGWRCSLPDGVEAAANFRAHPEQTVWGGCVPGSGVDWGTHRDPAAETAKLEGIYAALLDTSHTNCGFPLVNCLHSTNIHHLLFRARQTATGIELDGKYCYHTAYNFAADPADPTRDIPNDEASMGWMEIPRMQTLTIPLHHWEIEAAGPVAVGSRFDTGRYWEVRGALLPDLIETPLPGPEDLTFAWDQDRDGHPGMTNVMNGLLTGEVYTAVRFWQLAHLEVVRTTPEGRADLLKGLVETESWQRILGASKPFLAQDTIPNIYEDPLRTFIRMKRLPDDATCEDVIRLGRSELVCGTDYNRTKVDPADDAQWLCHSPVIDGANPAR